MCIHSHLHNNIINFTGAFFCDTNEILCEQYQRPYQYLVRLSDPTAILDTYTFTKSNLNKDMKNFLYVVLKYVSTYNSIASYMLLLCYLQTSL